jgi:hypothetical protein
MSRTPRHTFTRMPRGFAFCVGITLTEHCYVEALWYFDIPGGNVTGVVMRDALDRPWYALFRFRYYRDSRAFNSNDDRSWTRLAVSSDVALDPLEGPRLAMKVRIVFEATAAMAGSPLDWIEVRGGIHEAMAALATRPWAHVGKAD